MAVLSRQWELLAAKQQQDDIIRSRLRMPPQTPLCASTNDLSRPPAMNPRHQHFVGSSANARGGHRRSKSVGGDVAVWLEHKENHPVPLGTIFSPTGANIRKSATKIDLNDTLKATNYVLHHQTATSDGNVETQLFKVGTLLKFYFFGIRDIRLIVFRFILPLRRVPSSPQQAADRR